MLQTGPDESKQPEQMTVAELKAWLMNQGVPTKEKKRHLLDRYATNRHAQRICTVTERVVSVLG